MEIVRTLKYLKKKKKWINKNTKIFMTNQTIINRKKKKKRREREKKCILVLFHW